MVCKYKKVVMGKDGECDLIYPSCLNIVGICPIEEKYRDLECEAMMIVKEFGNEDD